MLFSFFIHSILRLRFDQQKMQIKLSIISLLIIFQHSNTRAAETNIDDVKPITEEEYHLPRIAWPNLYTVSILIDVKNLVYNGNVTIQFHVEEPTFDVTLNCRDVNVSWRDVILRNRIRQIPLQEFKVNNETETVVLTFREKLSISNYTLQVLLSGEIRNEPKGLYLISYQHQNQSR